MAPSETNFSGVSVPGIYTVISGRKTNHFAVNMESAESRTTPFSPEEFERLGVPLSEIASQVALTREGKTRLQNTELENRQKLWRWFLAAALVLLLFETWLAGRAVRRASMPLEAASTANEGAL
ncbi:MAG: hypothetical protein ACREIC_27260, partial [Limisphaerales bacterium]